MMSFDTEDQIRKFVKSRPEYEVFSVKISNLLRDLIKDSGIDVHIVESRVKTIESFSEKINRAGKNYKNPSQEITDLCGCRIITYYADDVERVSLLLKREFIVEEEELSHQAASFAADRFGYISAHYVVRISERRAEFREWQSMQDLKAEIQVRTVIQHAWSAVSHAISYKSKDRADTVLERRLYRIAGLFELADEEFVGVRDQKINLQKLAYEASEDSIERVPITFATVATSIDSWSRIDSAISAAREAGLDIYKNPRSDEEQWGDDESDDLSVVYDILDICSKVGIKDTKTLLQAVDFSDVEIKEFFSCFEGGKESIFTQDFIVFYLLLVRFPEYANLKYIVSRGWSEGRADQIARDAKKASLIM